MDYTWTEERWGSDKGYRIPKTAYVGVSWGGWWHASLFDAERNLWVRQDGVFPTAAEAREWAELLLEEALVG